MQNDARPFLPLRGNALCAKSRPQKLPQIHNHEKPPRWTVNPSHDVARHVLRQAAARSMSVSQYFVALAQAEMKAGTRGECSACPARALIIDLAAQLTANPKKLPNPRRQH